MSNQRKKTKNIQFPTAFTVLFIILIIAAVLTYIIPAGLYAKLSYDDKNKNFTVEKQDGTTDTLPATQATLQNLKINIDLNKFINGSIKKPIAIPGTYQKIEQAPQGVLSVIMSPVNGIIDTVDIMVFVLILGGIIGLIHRTGAFDTGIAALSKKTKGKEFLLVSFITVLISIGGTTFGLAEETIAFYPILMPIFLASGYDAIVCIAAIYMGSAIGDMFSTVNPFSVVIASDAAGISFNEGIIFRAISYVIALLITLIYIYRYAKKVKNDPGASLIYEDKERIEHRFLEDYNPDKVERFNLRRILLLVVFLAAFPVMIWGVSTGVWWFPEMSGLFFAVAVIIAFLTGLPEKEAVNTFISGAGELIGVVLIIGVARGINIIMDNGEISDTLLYYTSRVTENMNTGVFAAVQMIMFSILGFFIPSSSALATLSMPIMAPLADTVGVSRAVVVTAYNWGQGLMAFITPTGLILATLEMVDVTFDKWLKFILPLMGIIGVYSILMLILETVL
ncbi:MAG TPA: YfcC family protein [Mobilitalea sp.]|nr:YfcC family protein [Mobilitalea sp.]